MTGNKDGFRKQLPEAARLDLEGAAEEASRLAGQAQVAERAMALIAEAGRGGMRAGVIVLTIDGRTILHRFGAEWPKDLRPAPTTPQDHAVAALEDMARFGTGGDRIAAAEALLKFPPQAFVATTIAAQARDMVPRAINVADDLRNAATAYLRNAGTECAFVVGNGPVFIAIGSPEKIIAMTDEFCGKTSATEKAAGLFKDGDPSLDLVYPALLDVAREHLAKDGGTCLMLDNGRFEVIAGTPAEINALLPTLVRDRIGGPGMLTLLQQAALAHAEVSGGSFLLPTADGMAVLAFGPPEWVNQATAPTPLDPRRDNGALAPAHPEVLVEADMAVTSRSESFPGENALMKAAITATEFLANTDPRTAAIAIEGLGDGARFAVVVGTLPAVITYMAKASRDLFDSNARVDLLQSIARTIATEPFGGYVYDIGDARFLAIGSEQGLCNALIRKMAAHRGGTDALLRAAATVFLSQHNGEPAAPVFLSPNDGSEERIVICGTRDNCIAALARSVPRDEMQPLASNQLEYAHFTRAVPTPYRMTGADHGSAAFRSRWWLWLDPNDDSKALMVPSIQDAVTGPLIVTLHGLALHFEQSAL